MPKKKQHKQQLQLFSEITNDISQQEGGFHFDLISKDITPKYSRKNGVLYENDCIDVLRRIPSGSIDMIFADPPYNIKKADWDRFESQEQYISWSMQWISECSRILKENGSLFICGFTEVLADLKHPSMRYFKFCKWLIWHYKNKANLGSDWGRSHESILLLRKSNRFIMNIDFVRIPYNEHTLKYPRRIQAKSSQYAKGKSKRPAWSPHPLGAKPKDVIEIPTTCNGMGEKQNIQRKSLKSFCENLY